MSALCLCALIDLWGAHLSIIHYFGTPPTTYPGKCPNRTVGIIIFAIAIEIQRSQFCTSARHFHTSPHHNESDILHEQHILPASLLQWLRSFIRAYIHFSYIQQSKQLATQNSAAYSVSRITEPARRYRRAQGTSHLSITAIVA